MDVKAIMSSVDKVASIFVTIFLMVVVGVVVAVCWHLVVATPDTPTIEKPVTPPNNHTDPPRDQLGWESGYWYNESISITRANGLNRTERQTVVARLKARAEYIRQLEFGKAAVGPLYGVIHSGFEKTVSTSVISRKQLINRGVNNHSTTTQRTYINGQFEALFLVGEQNNAQAVLNKVYNKGVSGYYNPRTRSITIVKDNQKVQIDGTTLIHELTHALQHQYGLSSGGFTSDENEDAYRALKEGDANFVKNRYLSLCNSTWKCIQPSSVTQDAQDRNNISSRQTIQGVYSIVYFPYSTGPQFIDYIVRKDGWGGVNDLYENVPNATSTVISPNTTVKNASGVTINDTNSSGWVLAHPDQSLNGIVLGREALSAMFGYTSFDSYNESTIIPRELYMNPQTTKNASWTVAYNYDLPATQGWIGDRLHVYHNSTGATGYVLKTNWRSVDDARKFANRYRELLSHWGGSRKIEKNDTETWMISENSPFTDSFRIVQKNTTVTIVNAPNIQQIDNIHALHSNPSGKISRDPKRQ